MLEHCTVFAVCWQINTGLQVMVKVYQKTDSFYYSPEFTTHIPCFHPVTVCLISTPYIADWK